MPRLPKLPRADQAATGCPRLAQACPGCPCCPSCANATCQEQCQSIVDRINRFCAHGRGATPTAEPLSTDEASMAPRKRRRRKREAGAISFFKIILDKKQRAPAAPSRHCSRKHTSAAKKTEQWHNGIRRTLGGFAPADENSNNYTIDSISLYAHSFCA